MKILNISNMPLWAWGEGKGIPSTFFPQREFAKRGYEVYFLCPLRDGEPEESIVEGIHIYRFDFPFNFKKRVYIQTNTAFRRIRATVLYNLNWFFFQLFSAFRALKLGMRFGPDIVYAHSLTPAFTAFLVSALLPAKLIIRVYGTGELYWRRKEPWYRVRGFRDYLSFKVPADYFIVTDDGNYGDCLARECGVPDGKLRYWRNGIDEDMYIAEHDAKKELCELLKIDPSSKIIASTSRLVSYYYGVDRLILALAELFKRVPGAVCVMAGSGPDESMLKRMAADKGIASRIYFTGIVDRKMIKKILYASDIFVLLSRNHNCTNTMWEAMACGKCIVTTETDAIKEVLTTRDAVLLPSEVLDRELPKTLEGLLNDDNRRNEFGRNARRRAAEVLEPWAKRAEKEARLLEEMVCRR